jgi:hypothetical protein
MTKLIHPDWPHNGYCGSPNDSAWPIYFIEKYGLYRIGGSDGCNCVHLKLCAFEIDVSCHKSEHTIRVYSDDLGRNPKDLEILMGVVVSQDEAFQDYAKRYCGYQYDHLNGRWENDVWIDEMKCCYCGKPRFVKDDYLCESCKTKPNARAYYPWIGENI